MATAASCGSIVDPTVISASSQPSTDAEAGVLAVGVLAVGVDAGCSAPAAAPRAIRSIETVK